jgi:hypothetical protein
MTLDVCKIDTLVSKQNFFQPSTKEVFIDVLVKINPMHLHFLEPLTTWRILTVEKLFNECSYTGTYKHFHKILRKLEKNGIIQGFRDYYSRKKFIFSTEFGSELISEDEKITPHSNSMLHDAKLSELVYELRKFEKVKSFELEHVYRNGNQFIPSRDYDKYFPDAKLKNLRKGKEVGVAIELEITQKSVGRIINKFHRFIDGNDMEIVLYLFCNKSVMKKYIEVFKDGFESENAGKFIFYCNPNVLEGGMLFDDKNCFHSFKNYHQFITLFGERVNDDLQESKGGDQGV